MPGCHRERFAIQLAVAVVTRFDIASPGREQAIRLRPGWLDGRFELFERYCLPGIASQTEQGLTSFILLTKPRTIWAEQHRRIDRLGPVHHLSGPPTSMQVVHGGNVINSVRGRRVRLDRWADAFPAVPLRDMGAGERALGILGDNTVGQALRLGRKIVNRLSR